jgi:hypothetical protein
MPSKKLWPCTKENLQQMYQKLIKNDYQAWEEFAEIKQSIRIISPSFSNQDLYFCSFFIGCKKNPCKHSVLVMHYFNKTLVNPYSMSKPMEQRRKRGRPSLAEPALKRGRTSQAEPALSV